jgi:hypothetical protein
VLALNAADALPKAPKEDVVAARALLACAFAVRFDMAGLDEGKLPQGRCWIKVRAGGLCNYKTRQSQLQLRI